MVDKNIGWAIKRKKLTGSEVAKATGLNKATISRIIRGRSSPRISTVIKIGQFLEVQTWEELLGDFPQTNGNIVRIPSSGSEVSSKSKTPYPP